MSLVKQKISTIPDDVAILKRFEKANLQPSTKDSRDLEFIGGDEVLLLGNKFIILIIMASLTLYPFQITNNLHSSGIWCQFFPKS